MTPGRFYEIFPELVSQDPAQPDVVPYWIGFAGKLVDAARWGDLAEDGIALLAAHHVVLARQALAAASKRGGVPGVAAGVVSGKSIDKVSVSYDTGSAAVEGGAHFNLTTYGTRYLQLARMMGLGGLQL
ncbi:DUF4054 domain-containing protein [Salinarimonas soli]|uniref:DUF4054 domain-containing protein n=1 Tax=Salinarimonas soli TaxID=1638099 RepID=A0A5B2VGJ1_9HYPH|nr:DUF4054 domain-containing protein [Salinarimonas soli]KAA2237676.1 DUF4054 domain-containing protein [Salinarimonas soli]